MRDPISRLVCAGALLCALSACGGGGGGSNPAPPPAAPNRSPTIVTTAISTDEDVPLSTTLSATDPDGNPLTYSVSTAPAHGTLTVSAAGAASYTPALNYNGADSFAFHVSDGAGGEATGTVAVTIRAVNDLPQITSTQFTVAEDSSLTAQLLATDPEGDAVTFEYVPAVAHGTLTFAASGAFTYTPAPNYFGTDTMQVKVADPTGSSAVVPVTITVTNVNDPPTANDDTFRVKAGDPLPLLANDSDPDGDPLKLEVLQQPRGGTVAQNSAGTITFTPEHEFAGPIEFTYRVSDGTTTSGTAHVRAVIGKFNSLMFLADQTTLGKPEVHLYDGLQTRRISGDLPPDGTISYFWQSLDASTLIYVVRRPSADEVYVAPTDGSGPARRIYTGGSAANTNIGFAFLNRTATYALFVDARADTPKHEIVINVATGAAAPLAADNTEIVQTHYAAFGPDDTIYAQAQVGGTAPPSSPNTEYYTVYRASLANPRSMTRTGKIYPPGSGGSGNPIGFNGPNDRYAFYQEYVFGPPVNFAINSLVYDTQTGIESPLYRRAVPGEIGGLLWYGSADGEHTCLTFGEPGAQGTQGPARFYVGAAAAPGAAVAVTPAYPSTTYCAFAPDNRTLIYRAAAVENGPADTYTVNSANPGTPMQISRPSSATEVPFGFMMARNTMRVLLSYRQLSTQLHNWYSTSTNGSAPDFLFATQYQWNPNILADADDEATFITEMPINGARTDLRIVSTQTLNYSIPVTRSDAQVGVTRLKWLVDYTH